MASAWLLASEIPLEVKTVIASMQTGQERLVVNNYSLMHMLAAKLLNRVAHNKHHND